MRRRRGRVIDEGRRKKRRKEEEDIGSGEEGEEKEERKGKGRWGFFLMIRRQPRSKQSRSSAASDVYKRQGMKLIIKNSIVAFQKI